VPDGLQGLLTKDAERDLEEIYFEFDEHDYRGSANHVLRRIPGEQVVALSPTVDDMGSLLTTRLWALNAPEDVRERLQQARIPIGFCSRRPRLVRARQSMSTAGDTFRPK
jgi:hypothetical protein